MLGLKRKGLAILAAALLCITFVSASATAAVPGGVVPPTPASAPQPALVPLRLVGETLGAKVTWDARTYTATLTRGEMSLSLVTGEQAARIYGVPVGLEAAPFIVGDRTLVPLSLFTKLMGLKPEEQLAARAVGFVAALVQGRVEGFTPQLSDAFATAIPLPVLQATGKGLQTVGALQKVTLTGHTANAVHESVEMVAVFEKVTMNIGVRFTPAGAIDDISMIPYGGPATPAGAPAYADPSSFTEKEVVVGQGTFALPGTLTMPTGNGPFPVVVLVHGSGPNDRDETVGGVKVFRDLAQGLASRKIAVLRYEKRTREHAQKSAVIPSFGIQEESIADALAAVDLLSKTEGIDPKRIFVLGHSLGGFALPRILSQDQPKRIAGGISMAGPNSLLDVLLEQNRILAQAGLVPAAQVPFIEGQIAMLKDPAFDPAHPPKGFALAPAYYYADWRGVGSDLLKQGTTPVLFLQGQRDVQVPVDQVQSWKDGLGGRPGVTFKVYPKLNHLFTEGEGPLGLPAEYYTPANVPVYVVDDIAGWVGGL